MIFRLAFAALCFGLSLTASAALTPTHLRSEFLTNPLGIDEPSPRLSWIVESKERGGRQVAYRIQVASTPDALRWGRADLWDSGRVSSDETAHIEYRGKPLASGQRAWWRVLVWDGNGRSVPSRETAFWELGLLKRSDWRAKWIGLPEVGEPAPEMAGVKWIWFPEGNPAADAPPGDRFFRGTIEVNGEVRAAEIGFAVDDSFTATLNGRPLASGGGWTSFAQADVKGHLRPGRNELVVKAKNDTSRAGLAVAGRIRYADSRVQHFASGSSWEASKDAREWRAPAVLADLNGAPYGTTRWARVPLASPHLRRELVVRKPVRRARAYVSAKGVYKFFLDGQRVGNGIFTPGWTDYRKRIQYQTYDVTSRLKAGRHALGLVLGDGWYCGHIAWAGREQYGPKPMGLVQIEIEYGDGSRETVVSDGSWQATTGPILSSDMLMGETYDARRELGAWSSPGYRGRGWLPVDVQELGSVPLVAQRSPVVENLQELEPKSRTQPKPGTYIFDLGQNMVGWARIRASGPAGKAIVLRFAEMLNPDGTLYTTNLRRAKATETYTLKGRGQEVYEPSFTFHGFRYVEVTGYPGVPPMDAVTGVVVGSNTPQTGTFACSNAMVNQLQRNIFWGQRGNFLEVPTDCPQRDERLGWMGDAQVFARTASFNNDISAFMTKWMQDVEDAQSAEGVFADVSPRLPGPGFEGAPAWADAGVIVPWTMYLAYGDKRLLERHYDAMTRWIAFVDGANPDHIWSKRMGNNYGDWLNVRADTPREVLSTAYFAHSTDLVSRIARVLGKTEDAKRYEALREQIVRAFNARFVSADGKIHGDTQTVYVLALRFNLLPPALRPIAAKRLVDDITIARKGHLSTGFLGVGHLAPTLTSIGANDVAYRLLLNDTFPSWGYSIRQGATTIWERWDGWTHDKGFQDPGMNSFNHYSLGAIGEWMVATVAGIDLDPAAPAYKRIVIRPRPGGGLTWAKGTYDSLHGRIESGWRVSNGVLTMDMVIPANTTALVYVPGGKAEDAREAGVRYLRQEDGAAVFEVGGGRYRFSSRVP